MSKIKVLFLAANPIKKNILSLDEEIRAITEKIRMAEYRDSLDLIPVLAARPDDLLQALNQHKPHVVHFSGHGTSGGEIILVDNNRKRTPVSVSTLQMLFSTLKGNIRLVVLNACYSELQAKAITKVIDCAIGMNAPDGDNAAMPLCSFSLSSDRVWRINQRSFRAGKTSLGATQPERRRDASVDTPTWNRSVTLSGLRLDFSNIGPTIHPKAESKGVNSHSL